MASGWGSGWTVGMGMGVRVDQMLQSDAASGLLPKPVSADNGQQHFSRILLEQGAEMHECQEMPYCIALCRYFPYVSCASCMHAGGLRPTCRS